MSPSVILRARGSPFVRCRRRRRSRRARSPNGCGRFVSLFARHLAGICPTDSGDQSVALSVENKISPRASDSRRSQVRNKSVRVTSVVVVVVVGRQVSAGIADVAPAAAARPGGEPRDKTASRNNARRVAAGSSGLGAEVSGAYVGGQTMDVLRTCLNYKRMNLLPVRRARAVFAAAPSDAAESYPRHSPRRRFLFILLKRAPDLSRGGSSTAVAHARAAATAAARASCLNFS